MERRGTEREGREGADRGKVNEGKEGTKGERIGREDWGGKKARRG